MSTTDDATVTIVGPSRPSIQIPPLARRALRRLGRIGTSVGTLTA